MRAHFDARVIALLGAAAGASVACSTLLKLGDYSVQIDGGPAGAGGDASDEAAVNTGAMMDAGGPIHEASVDGPARAACDVDPRVQCYPCIATTQVQLLNACTSATCVAFDDTQRLANLLPDGALPPLPTTSPNDGGGQ